jgi:hypothetical protein
VGRLAVKPVMVYPLFYSPVRPLPYGLPNRADGGFLGSFQIGFVPLAETTKLFVGVLILCAEVIVPFAEVILLLEEEVK